MSNNTVGWKRISLGLAVWPLVFTVGLLACGSGSGASAATNSPAVEAATGAWLLDQYAATQAKIQKLGIYLKYECQRDGDVLAAPPNPRNGKSVMYESGEVCWDGRRCCVRVWLWGEVSATGDHKPKEDGPHTTYWFDGTRILTYGWSRKSPLGSGTITTKKNPDAALAPNEKLMPVSPDGALLGYLLGDRDRVDMILRRGTGLTLNRERDTQGQPGCYVLGVRTKQGRYTVWLDPARDFQIARAEIHRDAGDDYGGAKPLPPGNSSDYTLSLTGFQKVGDLWLPMEAIRSIQIRIMASLWSKRIS